MIRVGAVPLPPVLTPAEAEVTVSPLGGLVAATRAPRRVSVLPRKTPTPAAKDVLSQALKQFEQELGGRAQAVEVLSLATADPKLDPETAEYVIGLLADPKNADKPLSVIARDGGVELDDLLRLYRSSLVQKAHLLAIQVIARHTVVVVTDVMRRAAPYEDPCNVCMGVGSVTADPSPRETNPSPRTCETCKGTGRLVYPPQLETQKLALQLIGLVKQGGGMSVVVQQSQFQQQTQGQANLDLSRDTFLKVQQAADAILYGPSAGSVIDADPADPAAE